MGAAGREFARARFSWKKSAAGLISFYREILAGRV
jgi:glycosyltransferase involved in cell wall biosynthesis